MLLPTDAPPVENRNHLARAAQDMIQDFDKRLGQAALPPIRITFRGADTDIAPEDAAMFPAQRNSVYMPLAPLDGMGTVSSLRELWRRCNSYPPMQDIRLLDGLSKIPRQMPEAPFARQVAAMFRKLVTTLLA
jgi:hypothetical protein